MEYKGWSNICLLCLCSVETCPGFSLLFLFSRLHYLSFSPTVVPAPSLGHPSSLHCCCSRQCGKWEGQSQREAQTQPAMQQQRRAETMACGQDLERAKDNSTHGLKKENVWKYSLVGLSLLDHYRWLSMKECKHQHWWRGWYPRSKKW